MTKLQEEIISKLMWDKYKPIEDFPDIEVTLSMDDWLHMIAVGDLSYKAVQTLDLANPIQLKSSLEYPTELTYYLDPIKIIFLYLTGNITTEIYNMLFERAEN